METRKSFLALPFSSLLIFFLIIISLCEEGKGSSEEHHVKAHEGPLVKKSQIKTIVDTEYGEISAIMVKEGHKTPPYHLQFFTLEPNSVFLPVLLHADMVFYVYTGSGRLTWANEDGGTGTIDLREGDVCSLGEGNVFYIHSNLEAQRNKLRIYAMFSNTEDSTFDSAIGAYSRINNLVKGFDKKIMQAAFKVPEYLVEAITNKTETPAIVHAAPEKKNKHNSAWELEALFLKYGILSNSKKLNTYNIFTNDPDFKNVHGWTTTVTKKQLKQLKRYNIGFLMVNLTMGSMLGPHWNPRATEVAVVLQGEGMVRIVCGSNSDDEKTDECQNKRFRVKQGDVFVVPRFHPMAHMSFENEPLAFMGFSTAAKKNNPQFLVGKGSVLEILDKQILATSLGVSNRTIDKLLASPDESIIFGCDSCAEEEKRLMKEEEEKEKEEEEKRKKEEKEEEETEKRKEEEEERERKRKEEEEEEVRRREEERKREEEAARRQQEERERRKEEEEARRREEETRREKEREREEEAKKEQEKARRQREEEEARREREREEKAVAREEEQRKEEEEARRQREEEKARREREREEEQRREEEEAAEREQEKARRQQEKRERKREEEARREREREEEAAAREEEQRREEAAKRQEEKERRREEEEARREREEEEARREREREEEAARRQQEERERRREEEESEREQERGREEPAEGEEEAARRQQEERERRREEKGEREREEEQGESERGGGGRRRREEEESEWGREEEAPAEGEAEAARRQQQERERRRGDREREEEQSEREGGGGRRRRQRRGEEREESEASWEEEEARREQEERERRREQGRDNKSIERKVEGRSFKGRRVLKMRNFHV